MDKQLKKVKKSILNHFKDHQHHQETSIYHKFTLYKFTNLNLQSNSVQLFCILLEINSNLFLQRKYFNYKTMHHKVFHFHIINIRLYLKPKNC